MGWYHTGGRIYPNDFEISQYMQTHIENVHCLVISTEEQDPIKIYKYENEKMLALKFKIEAEEAEEVGVEHLTRDYKDEEDDIVNGLEDYKESVDNIVKYLKGTSEMYNNEILFELQECLNDFPIVSVGELKDVYFGSLVKSVVRLKDLIGNRKENIIRERIAG